MPPGVPTSGPALLDFEVRAPTGRLDIFHRVREYGGRRHRHRHPAPGVIRAAKEPAALASEVTSTAISLFIFLCLVEITRVHAAV